MSEKTISHTVASGGKSQNRGRLARELERDEPEKRRQVGEGRLGSCVGLLNLGQILAIRFDNSRNLEDIRNAIRCQRLVLSLVSENDRITKSLALNFLGVSYMRRFDFLEELEDLHKAFEYQSQAVLLVPRGHESEVIQFNNLGNAYMRRFERHGDVKDADNGIEWRVKAIQLTPDSHPIKHSLLTHLGVSYIGRSRQYNNVLDDVDNAIKCLEKALQLTPDGHALRPTQLDWLGISYAGRFDRHGDASDLDRAIRYHMQAVQLTPRGDMYKPGRLSHLGNSYRRRFQFLGDILDIDKAIECHIQCVQLTPDGDSEKLKWLNHLGSGYMCRFDRTRDAADIDRSIECHARVVQLTPDGHINKPHRLNSLGGSYSKRFDRHGQRADIDNAIKCFMQAVQLTPDGHTIQSALFANLGTTYRSRFNRHGSDEDIENSIECTMKAMRLIPDGHTDRPGLLASLGESYIDRFKKHEGVEDVENSIECYMQAVQLTPDGHAEKPSRLANLGRSYMDRFTQLSEPADLVAASALLKQAAQSIAGNPQVRFTAACTWARCSRLLGDSPHLAYQQIVELVPRLAWIGTPIEQRYDLLRKIPEVGAEAAQCAISLKEYDRALEWLEQGRSVVWNQVLQLRTPFDDLYAAKPELAERLKEVSLELERAGSRPAPSLPPTDHDVYALDPEKDGQRHRRLAAEWDRLLEEARNVPGFAGFMRPPKAAELMRAAKNGPVVVINVHPAQCDALVIQPNNDTIAHIPLDNFSYEKAIDAHEQVVALFGYRGGRAGGFRRAIPADKTRQLRVMLGSLFSGVVKPVFNFLGYTHALSTEELPRVTWCTTGPLSFVPLHAAGYYEGSQPKALDLAVSSYTPTLSALLAPSPPTQVQSAGIVGVGQEYTKGQSDLPYTIQELAAIKEHARGIGYMQLDGENATVDAVLAAMEEYSWVHLACHAAQHKQNPAQSAFLLHDGNLMLSTITQSSFKNKGLAFLSACQTATGDESLPDEAVHLAAGMLMAGYPSVIATMWSIQDDDGPEIARQVYADLLANGEMDCTKAARALHKAVVGLRNKVGEESFERWLPFIHIGV